MEYKKLVELYSRIESTSSRLEKTAILADFFSSAPKEIFEFLPLLITGEIFAAGSIELGIGPGMLYNAVSFVTGVKKSDIENYIREEGDIGLAVKAIFEKKKVQKTFFTQELTVEKVYSNFRKIAEASGGGAQEKKTKLLVELLTPADSNEAMYLARSVLGELRIGAAEGIIIDAISKAFSIDSKLVERAFMLANNLGKVAKIAREEGEEGLKKITIEVGIPLRPMLAQAAPSLGEAVEEFGTCAIETKYDGARVQIHKKGEVVKIYSRRLEDVTSALPDVAENVKKAVEMNEVILDGETVAIDRKTGKPRAFQDILKRFRRKYDIEKMIKEIPFETYIFDVLYADGRLMIDEPFKERRGLLKKIITALPNFMVAEQVVTDDIKKAETFYNESLKRGHEGVMVKNLSAAYVLGSRVGHMYKVKPTAETLDLAIIGAIWGSGKRAGWLGSYYLGAKDELGNFKEVGRVATGLSDEQLEEYTNLLKPLIEYQKGTEVKIKPSIVVEVGYQEIQKSPKYDSGFALRFPRILRIREDKSVEEVDTLERIEKLQSLKREK